MRPPTTTLRRCFLVVLIVATVAVVGLTAADRLPPLLRKVRAAPTTITVTPSPESNSGYPKHSTINLNSGSVSPIEVVGLGDSVMTGTGCDCDDFLHQFGSRLAQGKDQQVSVTSVSHDGWTSNDIVSQLADDTVRTDIADANVVVIEIGANDFDSSALTGPNAPCLPASTSPCWSSALGDLKTNLTAIMSQVHALSRSGAQIAVVGYWNVFRDGSVGESMGENYVRGSDGLTRDVNAMLEQAAVSVGAHYVDTYTPFRGSAGGDDDSSLLVSDGDHPNAQGSQEIAAAVYSTLYGKN